MLIRPMINSEDVKYDSMLILNSIQSHMNMGYCFFYFNEEYISFDKYALKMFEMGDISEDVDSDSLRSIVHPDDWEDVKQFVREIPNGYKNKISFRVLTVGGFIKWFEAKLSPNQFYEESLVCITIIDITSLKKAQNYQKNTLKIAQKYEVTQKQFVKNLSDDFDKGIDRIMLLCNELVENCDDNPNINEIKNIVFKWAERSKSTQISLRTSLDCIGNISKVLVIYNGHKKDIELWNDMKTNCPVDVDLVQSFNEVMLALNEHNYDAIVMDAYLEQASGIQIISYVRSMKDVYRDATIIVWADVIEDEVKRSFFKAGTNYFVERSLLKLVCEKAIPYDDIYLQDKKISSLGLFSGIYRYIDLSAIDKIINEMDKDEFCKYTKEVLDRSKRCIKDINIALEQKDKIRLSELFGGIATDVKAFGEEGISDSISLIRDALMLQNTAGLAWVVADFLKEFDYFVEELEIFLGAFIKRDGNYDN